MTGLGTAAAVIGIVTVTQKVLSIGYTILRDNRSYGVDAHKLALRFEQGAHRYNSLSRLLFERQKLPSLKDKILFELLPEYTQKIVLELFQELLRVLYSFFSLEQRYASLTGTISAPPVLHSHLGLDVEEQKLVFTGTSAPQEIKAHKTLLFLSASSWSWAIGGKKKATKIVDEFDRWLKYTRSVLEDTWWPLDAFATLAHLDVLVGDHDSQISGVAATAKLRKLIIGRSSLSEVLKEPWASFDEKGTLSASKKLGVLQGSYVLVEGLAFRADEDGELPGTFNERFSKIVSFLNSQDDPDFRVLKCLKYSMRISQGKVDLRLISRIGDAGTRPILRTLLSLYPGSGLDRGLSCPSLGVRCRICHDLAESLFLLHSVDWVHRALRSDNVVFIFSNNDVDQRTFAEAQLRVCGFEASRPAQDVSLGPYDNQPARNVYRHPQRWGAPRENMTQLHDIYSLGVIMLELGLWTRAESMIESLRNEERVPTKVYERLLDQVDRKLARYCGDRFAGVVRMCLTSQLWDDERAQESGTASLLEQQQLAHSGLLFNVIQPLKELADVL